MAERGSWRADRKSTHKVHGTFSEQEKEAIRSAVEEYAQAHGLVDADCNDWLFDKKRRGIWKEVAKRLPDRTTQSVWACGVRMFKQVRKGVRWTPEEDQKLLEIVEEKGKKWKMVGETLERFPEACRDRWREIRLGRKQRTGRWSEEEVQRLESVVMKMIEEKNALHHQTEAQPDTVRHVLHDINWGLVSEKHGTRNSRQCCQKWYDMKESIDAVGPVDEDKETEMLENIVQLGADEEYEVPWDSLIMGVSPVDAKRHWKLLQRKIPRCTKKTLSLVGQAQYILAYRRGKPPPKAKGMNE